MMQDPWGEGWSFAHGLMDGRVFFQRAGPGQRTQLLEFAHTFFSDNALASKANLSSLPGWALART